MYVPEIQLCNCHGLQGSGYEDTQIDPEEEAAAAAAKPTHADERPLADRAPARRPTKSEIFTPYKFCKTEMRSPQVPNLGVTTPARLAADNGEDRQVETPVPETPSAAAQPDETKKDAKIPTPAKGSFAQEKEAEVPTAEVPRSAQGSPAQQKEAEVPTAEVPRPAQGSTAQEKEAEVPQEVATPGKGSAKEGPPEEANAGTPTGAKTSNPVARCQSLSSLTPGSAVSGKRRRNNSPGASSKKSIPAAQAPREIYSSKIIRSL